MTFSKFLKAALAPAAIACAGLMITPADAAENASITRVELAFDRACTVASPTVFGTSFQYTGNTDDGAGEDYVQVYHLDGNNTVVSRNTGSATSLGAPVGATSSPNAFTIIVAAPATGPYTAVLWDADDGTFDFEGGDTFDLNASQVLATLEFDMNALDADCPGTPSTGPAVASIERQSPTSEKTNADALTWRVTFSGDVQYVDAGDFDVSGTTADVSAVSAVSATVYDVTVSGGDLADLNSTSGSPVGLGFDAAQDIADLSDAPLSDTTPTGANETYEVNNTAPVLRSVTRQTPPSEATNADSLTWDFQFATISPFFSLNAADFTLTGSSASLSVTRYSIGFYVTASGGDLADLDGTVEIALQPGAADEYGNVLASGTPTDDDENSYTLDNTAPSAAVASDVGATVGGPFGITITFSEDVGGFAEGDIVVSNATLSDFQQTSGSVYSALVTPTADGVVTVDIPGSVATDVVGNANTAAPQLSVTKVSDATPPDVVLSTSATSPVNAAFEVTATFTEDVTGFELSDLHITNGSASNAQVVSARVYTATITPTSDGEVTITIPAGAAQDAAGNDSTAANTVSITNDQTAPTVVLSTTSADPVTGAFTLTATFSEDVTGFEVSDIAVANGAASNFTATSAAIYTTTITPAADGAVTVDVAAGAAQDVAGNASTAADQFSIGFDGTPPGLTISLPGATAVGPFTATFTFSEAVTGFGLEDIAVTNAAASQLRETGAGTFTATITPETVGDVVISVAEGAAVDAAGNESEADSASIEIVFPEVDVALDLTSTVLDATTVSQSVTLTNPGSQPLDFVATVDVNWADVSPSSGTIPASGALNFTITLNALADQLEPGQYTGAVTVSTAPEAASASTGSTSTGSTVVATIPVAASVAARFGSLQITATTPGGLQGDETFTYASSDNDLDGLSLTTSGGSASSAPLRKVFGTYDLTQNLPQGWTLDSLSCAGDTDGGSVIDVAAGTVDIDLDANETIVCTFANTRDEEAVRLATMRAINNFMVRRADQLLGGAPDLSTRLRDRASTSPGRFSADVEGGNVQMNFAGSLSGLRNHAKANERQVPGGSDTAEPDESRFDVWFAASYTAIDDDRAGDAADSSFGLFQLGADWLVSENALVGLMVQIDQMAETHDNIVEAAGGIAGAELDGTGWMAGPYAVWEVADGTTLDVMALWGQSDNSINPLGFYEDDFDTTRYMLRANLTGEWRPEQSGVGDLVIRPGVAWSHFEETQDAYIDSLGITIPEQTVSIGRLEAGPEVAYRVEGNKPGSWWEPNAQLRAVWDYDGADLMDESGRTVDTDGIRADASVGIRGQWSNGAIISAEARFSGLGDSDFSANGARLELRVPF